MLSLFHKMTQLRVDVIEYSEVIYTSQNYFLLQQNVHQLSYGWIVYQQCGLCFPGSFTNDIQWFSHCKSTSPVTQLDSCVIINVLTEVLYVFQFQHRKLKAIETQYQLKSCNSAQSCVASFMRLSKYIFCYHHFVQIFFVLSQ